ncbi:MAG: hypothetical protein QN167_13135 [Armatimonadota bacterium]|nr:hypothetical protein [Armatimonadota bacterium]
MARTAVSTAPLTPAQWAAWVGQRHEWSGLLWLRWPDAEAVLLFVQGQPLIRLWEREGWADGGHALSAVAQRLGRVPPRWGRIPLAPEWARQLRDLTVVHPAVPVGVIRPDAWLAWASLERFEGLALLLDEEPRAWIVHDGAVTALRFQDGLLVPAETDGVEEAAAADGLFCVYAGRVTALAPAGERNGALGAAPTAPPPAGPRTGEPASGTTAQADDAAVLAPNGAETPAAEPPPPSVSAPPAQAPPAAAPAGLSAAAGEPTGEGSRRFRGDERFLLAPAADGRCEETEEAVAARFGRSVLEWLPLLDGTRTVDEVAGAAGAPREVVDRVVAFLLERRLVFRYLGRRPST